MQFYGLKNLKKYYPNLEIGYHHSLLKSITYTVKGLSKNYCICVVKINQ